MNHSLDYEAQLRQEIDFLRDCQMERDLRGHSQVPCFILHKTSVKKIGTKRTNTKYFMKVYRGNRVDELKYIESAYKLAHIPTAFIVKIGYLEMTNQTFCIYDFIEGDTLGEWLSQALQAQAEEFGIKVGEELRKFVKLKGDSQKIKQAINLELSELLMLAHSQKISYNQNHAEPLPEVDLYRLEKSMQNLKPALYATTPVFIHSDLNLNNIIINQGKPYFIDTEGSQIGFRALNFRGNCWWCWNGDDTAKEQAVYRGIYRGAFHNQIPASFHQELGFAVMYQFLHRVKKYSNNEAQVHYSFLHWRDLLEQTHYFENYKFDWF